MLDNALRNAPLKSDVSDEEQTENEHVPTSEVDRDMPIEEIELEWIGT